MVEITLEAVGDWAALAARWEALAQAAAAGPFLAWQFVGCRAESRYTTPCLLAVREGGADVALALLNRAGGKFFLHATGDPRLDAVFMEHNGLLCRPDDAGRVLQPALRRLTCVAPLVAGGVDERFFRAAGQVGIVTRHQARFAPAVDLAALPRDFLDSLSANARGQIRRAMRLCGAGLALQRAPDAATAGAWFDDMVGLHQASWEGRGEPGAFANPAMREFHAALIADGGDAGIAELLRISDDAGTLGILYMLRRAGHVCCYQSGFRRNTDARQKPGLVAHSLAIELYRSEGATNYDLLAGPARYKTTLAHTGGQMLHWFTLHPKGDLGACARVLAERVAERVAGRLRGARPPGGRLL